MKRKIMSIFVATAMFCSSIGGINASAEEFVDGESVSEFVSDQIDMESAPVEAEEEAFFSEGTEIAVPDIEINENGTVKAVKKGTCKITVKSGKKKFVVTVKVK